MIKKYIDAILLTRASDIVVTELNKPDLEDYFLHVAKGKKQISMKHVI